MAKDFCQDGVSVNTQFGKNGPRFKSVSGALQARDSGDTAFAVVSGADPIADDDFVTKRWGLANLGGGGSLPPGLPHSDSIVFYVDASDPESYPGSGSVVVDRTGNATNGSLDGGAVVSGGAFVFDQTVGKGVGFDKNATLDNLFDGPATVMTFIRQNAINSGSGRFVSTESGTVGWGLYGYFVFGIDGIRPRLVLRSGGGTDGVWSGTGGALPNLGISGGGDAYGSMAVSLDASTLSNDPTFYINGQAPTTPAGTNPSALGDDAATDIVIGNDNGGTLNPPTDSQITLIWNRILTQVEIQQVHNLFAPRMTLTGGTPGITTVQTEGGATGTYNTIRAGGLEQGPGIPSGCTGCTDLGFYSGTGRGFVGAGTERASILSGFNNKMNGGADNACIVSGVSNEILGNSVGVICGGSGNTLGGGGPNFMGAGSSNSCGGNSSAVVAGFQNTGQPFNGSYNFLGAGSFNTLGDGGIIDNNVLVGGVSNIIGRGDRNFIGAGQGNQLGAFGTFCHYAFIGAGQDNRLGRTGSNDSSNWSAVVAGKANAITGGQYAFIGAGQTNTISGTSPHTLIGSGENNRIRNASGHAAIVGGETNDINLTSPHSAIGGGNANDITTSAFATIPGGRLNDIDGADYAYAGGRQSKVTHAGANVTSDGNAVDADSIVAHENFQAFSGGIRRVTTNGFRGEAWVTKNTHATTTTTTPDLTTLDTLDTDQHTMVLMVDVHSARDTGDNFKFTSFLVYASRTGGGLTVNSATVVAPVGGGVTHSIGGSGDNIVLTITALAGPENWQHTVRWRRQEGGFTS